MHFTDQIVVITGGSRGLGFAMAKRFLREGAQVALLARDADVLAAAVAKLPPGAKAFACDIRKPRALRAVITRIEQEMGPIDVLVNNAGILQVSPFEQVELKEFEDCLNTNFWAPLHAVQAVLPSMKARGRGHIINICSFGGLVSLPRLLPYVASKHALVGLSQGLYAELKPLGIHVTTVNPGLMRSGSHWNLKVRGPNKLAFAVGAIMYSSPLAQNAEVVAKKAIRAAIRKTPVVDLTLTTTFLRLAQAVAPNLFVRATALIGRVMPVMEDATLHTAADSQSVFAPSVLTAVADHKAVKLNERLPTSADRTA